METTTVDREQLWQLVRGELPAEQTATVCSLVGSDPAVARAYVEVKLEHDLQQRRPYAAPENGTACSTSPRFFRRGCLVLVIVALQFVTHVEETVKGGRTAYLFATILACEEKDRRDTAGFGLRWLRKSPAPRLANARYGKE